MGDGDPDAGHTARTDLDRKVQRLHDVAMGMRSATDVDGIYDRTVDAAVDILGFDWCVIEIADEGYFEIAAASEQAPLSVGDRPITIEHGLTGEAYWNRESIVTYDAFENSDAEPTTDQFRAGLTVPLGERGVFQGLSAEPNFFDEDDLELAELLIAHATAAVDRVEETRRLTRLNEATRRLMTAETHEEIARVGVDIVASLLEAPVTVIYAHDEARGALVPLAATDGAGETLSTGPVDPDDGVAWSAFREGRTVREAGPASDGDADGDADADDYRTDLGTALGDHGAIRVRSSVRNAFDGDEIALVETIAANVEAAFTRADRERERREHHRELRRQNERLDRFASVVSHDLRNPLNVATVRTAMLAEECESDHVDHVEGALSRMGSIIEETLALARQGRSVEETERVRIDTLARESWAHVDTGDASLQIAADASLRADPDRLRRAFENLFRNAVEHGSTSNRPESGDAVEHESTDDPSGLTVRVGALDDGFYVADDGPGIPEDERERVLELGYSTADGGTGFGLAIVKEIVEAHGWEVAVAEGERGGARFEIRGVEDDGGMEDEDEV